MFWLIIFLYFLFSPSVIAIDPQIKITNFSSNSSPEWVEIHNQSGTTIDLANWKIGDSNPVPLYDLTLSGCLSADGYLTINHESGWLNDSGDTIYLYNNSNTIIDTLVYTTGKIDNAPKNTNTCIPSLTPTLTPSPTPTVTNTPVPTNTPLPTNTPSPTNTPTLTHTPTPTPTSSLTPTTRPSATPIPTVVIEEPPVAELTPIIEPTPQTVSVGSTSADSILGISDIIKPTPSGQLKNFSVTPTTISIIFIVFGGLLLFIPVIIYKLKS